MDLNIDLGNGAFMIYGTPVYREVLPDVAPLCAALERIVLAHEAAEPELRTGRRNHSNQGGWRSPPDLFKWPEPEIATLRDLVVQKLLEMMQLPVADRQNRYVEADIALAGWVNVNRDGDYNVMHCHAGNHWSGAFYPAIGKPDDSVECNGAFEFYEPRGVATMAKIPGFPFGQCLPVQPEPGLMMIFPAFLQHAVRPFRGEGARISIAFNARVQRLEVKER